MKRIKRRLGKILKGLFRTRLRTALTLLCLSLIGWLSWEVAAWPDVGRLRQANPQTSAFIELYRQRQREQGRNDQVQQVWMPYEKISLQLKRAVLAAEDINFFGHSGFALEEIKEAVKEAVQEGEFPRGASTITQQLARNLWLSPSKNPVRKLREAILTYQLESNLSKRRILELYLNLAEFGEGIYGAEAAARRYFALPASALNESQAAQLAAGLPRPKSWNPTSQSKAYRRHVSLIEERMQKADWLIRLL